MKKLLLVRHAKAEKISPNQKDFDRELANRGLMDAPRIAQTIYNEGIVPQLLVSSPAVRAISTAFYFAEQFKIDTTAILQNEDIFEASPGALLKIVNQFSDEVEFIAMFGHNPGFSYLAEYLTGYDIGEIPTCGAVLLHFEVESWSHISQNTGTLHQHWYPAQVTGDK